MLTRREDDEPISHRAARSAAPAGGALHAMLEAAKGLPDLLKARREALEARWRGEMAARHT